MATWKGVTVDQRTADMLTACDILELPDVSFQPSQGSYSTGVGASAGTHAGGGAVDIALAGLSEDDASRIETAMRRVGFAAWYRRAIPNVWPRHVHGIAIGCSDLASAAAAQVTDYLNGRDGLAGHGPDTGSRAYVDDTWESYHTQHPYVLEDIMASLADVKNATTQSINDAVKGLPASAAASTWDTRILNMDGSQQPAHMVLSTTERMAGQALEAANAAKASAARTEQLVRDFIASQKP